MHQAIETIAAILNKHSRGENCILALKMTEGEKPYI